MALREDDPKFWETLYRPPRAGSEDFAAGDALRISEADMRAEVEHREEAPALELDEASVRGLVERLVEEKVQALLASGALVAPSPVAAPAPPQRSRVPAPPEPPQRPRALAAPPEPPQRPRAPAPPEPPIEIDDDASVYEVEVVADTTSEVEVLASETSEAEPVRIYAEGSQPSQRKVRSLPSGSGGAGEELAAVAVLGEDDEDDDQDDPPFAVDEEAEFELGGDEEFEIEDDGDDEAEFEFAGEEDDESDEDEAPVDLIDLAALWDQVATLPGGQASLLSGNQLGQDGIQVLVMVDGYTSLRGLRTLAPHVDDDRFHHIVHAAVVAGLLAFE